MRRIKRVVPQLWIVKGSTLLLIAVIQHGVHVIGSSWLEGASLAIFHHFFPVNIFLLHPLHRVPDMYTDRQSIFMMKVQHLALDSDGSARGLETDGQVDLSLLRYDG